MQYNVAGNRVTTSGLAAIGQAELTLCVRASDLLPEATAFLTFVAEYIKQTSARIRSGQTLNYGYWLVRFDECENGALDVSEYEETFSELRPGADRALRYWRDQRKVCIDNGSEFDPPNPGTLTSVSAGVMEGGAVRAVRYRPNDGMSGWIIVTDQYDGDVASLMNHHTYHLTAARPDIAKYLALTYGFRFDQPSGGRVWFDREVATSG